MSHSKTEAERQLQLNSYKKKVNQTIQNSDLSRDKRESFLRDYVKNVAVQLINIRQKIRAFETQLSHHRNRLSEVVPRPRDWNQKTEYGIRREIEVLETQLQKRVLVELDFCERFQILEQTAINHFFGGNEALWTNFVADVVRGFCVEKQADGDKILSGKSLAEAEEILKALGFRVTPVAAEPAQDLSSQNRTLPEHTDLKHRPKVSLLLETLPIWANNKVKGKHYPVLLLESDLAQRMARFVELEQYAYEFALQLSKVQLEQKTTKRRDQGPSLERSVPTIRKQKHYHLRGQNHIIAASEGTSEKHIWQMFQRVQAQNKRGGLHLATNLAWRDKRLWGKARTLLQPSTPVTPPLLPEIGRVTYWKHLPSRQNVAIIHLTAPIMKGDRVLIWDPNTGESVEQEVTSLQWNDTEVQLWDPRWRLPVI